MLPRVLTAAGFALAAATQTYVTDENISATVTEWRNDAVAAEAAHGHISTWDTSDVTNMDNLFLECTSFDEDISAWHTARVTSMYGMFMGADFNSPVAAGAICDAFATWRRVNAVEMGRVAGIALYDATPPSPRAIDAVVYPRADRGLERL